MIKFHEQLKTKQEYSKQGKTAFTLYDLSDFEGMNSKVKLFSRVEIEVGEQVEYHIHEGNAESYYIISGEGLYDDNGSLRAVGAGTITFTPSGSGHALKNIGKEKLVFVALILED